MKIAAVNFDASFAQVDENLARAGHFIEQAATDGAELVLLPEFFTSSMGYSERMLDVAVTGQVVEDWLKEVSRKYGVIVGGSSLSFDGRDAHNLFQLVEPDGTSHSHSKDIPTLVENCYYAPGDTEHILHTSFGDIGVALCWEMVRQDTLRRLSGKVDIVLAGMCWADLPDWDGGAELKRYNRDFARRTPIRFAELVKAPVIHANHCGTIRACDFPDDKKAHTLQMIGATQIIAADGRVLAERRFDEGAGVITADISWEGGKREPAVIEEGRYWLEDMPEPYLYSWQNNNRIGTEYYNRHAKPYYCARYAGS
ncbi:MAG: carbon-nitrogen hydrolase family protein [Planctomycetes bacterium]|nr:carbon-nitrogen hydrolase family protein [Planctomycetota bacterium]